ncbi:2OG-Fe(II) oxygenase-like protein 4 [Elsinoe australis]|uniref:2OG-Fe(II) oxygenase-like protein 4 n=1 Tax=Elsinoe australis TaxID=40998 RepID=A0A4U7B5X6_9PEZI|nr:2OG-Fe(II) oxygenase-like protein 4 [Elsinoe australis]
MADPPLPFFTPTLLSTHSIPSLPPTMYYLPSFLTPSEQSQILASLPPNKWTRLTHRRLQAHPSALSKSGTLLSAPLPDILSTPILARFHSLGIFEGSPHGNANHCLVNEYEPGQGIMGHEDGGSYWPCTATVSLGGSVVLDVWEKGGAGDEGKDGDGDRGDGRGRRWRILQEAGSLLVTMGEVYSSTLHGIAEVEVDEDLNGETVANWDLLGDREKVEREGGKNVRVTRTSLTYRDVIKVSNAGRKILGFGKR